MSGFCDFCGVWHSGSCCNPARVLYERRGGRVEEQFDPADPANYENWPQEVAEELLNLNTGRTEICQLLVGRDDCKDLPGVVAAVLKERMEAQKAVANYKDAIDVITSDLKIAKKLAEKGRVTNIDWHNGYERGLIQALLELEEIVEQDKK